MKSSTTTKLELTRKDVEEALQDKYKLKGKLTFNFKMSFNDDGPDSFDGVRMEGTVDGETKTLKNGNGILL